MTALTVFSPCYYLEDPPVHRLRHSCRTLNIPLVCYGVGQQYQPHGIESHIRGLMNVLQNTDPGDDDLILFTDAFDSWLIAGADEIVPKFRSFSTPIVIAAERDCWPVARLRDRFPDTKSPYRWLNAGGMIGERKALIRACWSLLATYGEGATEELQRNPQGLWSLGLVEGVVEAAIDNWCRIFQTMSGGGGSDVLVPFSRMNFGEPRRAVNTATDSTPCVIHHNGRCGDDAAVERSYRTFYPTGESVPESLGGTVVRTGIE